MITKSAIVFGGIATVHFGLTMGFIVKDATKKYEEDCDYLMILGGTLSVPKHRAESLFFA